MLALIAAGNIVQGQIPRGQRSRICLDPNRAFNAINVHLRNARQNVEALLDLGGGVFIKIAVGQRVTGQRDISDRLIVRIGLEERRRTRQIARAVGRWHAGWRIARRSRRLDRFRKIELEA